MMEICSCVIKLPVREASEKAPPATRANGIPIRVSTPAYSPSSVQHACMSAHASEFVGAVHHTRKQTEAFGGVPE